MWTAKNGHTTVGDFQSAELGYFTPIDILKREAENENPEAQYYLALCYCRCFAIIFGTTILVVLRLTCSGILLELWRVAVGGVYVESSFFI